MFRRKISSPVQTPPLHFVALAVIVAHMATLMLSETRLQTDARLLGALAEASHHCQFDLKAWENVTSRYNQAPESQKEFEAEFLAAIIAQRETISSLRDGRLSTHCAKLVRRASRHHIRIESRAN